MSNTLPTVAVKMDDIKVLINTTDYDESVHELWTDEELETSSDEEFKEVDASFIHPAAQVEVKRAAGRPKKVRD